jgi:hypothetical protein
MGLLPGGRALLLTQPATSSDLGLNRLQLQCDVLIAQMNSADSDW